MPLAQITLIEGSTGDQKRALIAEVTNAISSSLGASPSTIRVLLTEMPADHWGVAGLSMQDRDAATASPAPAPTVEPR